MRAITIFLIYVLQNDTKKKKAFFSAFSPRKFQFGNKRPLENTAVSWNIFNALGTQSTGNPRSSHLEYLIKEHGSLGIGSWENNVQEH